MIDVYFFAISIQRNQDQDEKTNLNNNYARPNNRNHIICTRLWQKVAAAMAARTATVQTKWTGRASLFLFSWKQLRAICCRTEILNRHVNKQHTLNISIDGGGAGSYATNWILMLINYIKDDGSRSRTFPNENKNCLFIFYDFDSSKWLPEGRKTKSKRNTQRNSDDEATAN